MDALRIRMEGGMERIEEATLEAQRLARRLGRAAGPVSSLFVGKRALAEEIAGFLRGQPEVEVAVDRLARVATTEGMTEETAPQVLREWRRARTRLGEKAARACEALVSMPTGSLREDLARLEGQLRGPRPEPLAALPPVPPDPAAPPAPVAPLVPAGPVAAGRFAAEWEQYLAHQGWGAMVNAIGPVVIAAMAFQGATFGTLAAFFAWGAANLRWMRRMARWPCPSCGKPFAQWRVVFAPYCEHCGLKKLEGARTGQLGPGGPPAR